MPRAAHLIPLVLLILGAAGCSRERAVFSDENARVTALWADNFGVTNRYEMPMKSSV